MWHECVTHLVFSASPLSRSLFSRILYAVACTSTLILLLPIAVCCVVTPHSVYLLTLDQTFGFFFISFKCVLKWISVCMCVHVHMYTCVEVKGQAWRCRTAPLIYVISLPWSSVIRSGWLTTSSGILHICLPYCGGYRHALPHLVFMWILETRLRSLGGKVAFLSELSPSTCFSTSWWMEVMLPCRSFWSSLVLGLYFWVDFYFMWWWLCSSN